MQRSINEAKGKSFVSSANLVISGAINIRKPENESQNPETYNFYQFATTATIFLDYNPTTRINSRTFFVSSTQNNKKKVLTICLWFHKGRHFSNKLPKIGYLFNKKKHNTKSQNNSSIQLSGIPWPPRRDLETRQVSPTDTRIRYHNYGYLNYEQNGIGKKWNIKLTIKLVKNILF